MGAADLPHPASVVASCNVVRRLPDVVSARLTSTLGGCVAEARLRARRRAGLRERRDGVGATASRAVGHAGVLIVVAVAPDLAHGGSEHVTSDDRVFEDRSALRVTAEVVGCARGGR